MDSPKLLEHEFRAREVLKEVRRFGDRSPHLVYTQDTEGTDRFQILVYGQHFTEEELFALLEIARERRCHLDVYSRPGSVVVRYQ